MSRGPGINSEGRAPGASSQLGSRVGGGQAPGHTRSPAGISPADLPAKSNERPGTPRAGPAETAGEKQPVDPEWVQEEGASEAAASWVTPAPWPRRSRQRPLHPRVCAVVVLDINKEGLASSAGNAGIRGTDLSAQLGRAASSLSSLLWAEWALCVSRVGSRRALRREHHVGTPLGHLSVPPRSPISFLPDHLCPTGPRSPCFGETLYHTKDETVGHGQGCSR